MWINIAFVEKTLSTKILLGRKCGKVEMWNLKTVYNCKTAQCTAHSIKQMHPIPLYPIVLVTNIIHVTEFAFP